MTVRTSRHQRKARLRNRPSKRGWVMQANDPPIAAQQNRAERRVDPDAGASAGDSTFRLSPDGWKGKHRMPSPRPLNLALKELGHASVTVGSAEMPAPFALAALYFAHVRDQAVRSMVWKEPPTNYMLIIGERRPHRCGEWWPKQGSLPAR